MSTFVPKFHVSFADMHCENAQVVNTEDLMGRYSADLLNSKNVNVFFRVGFVQQGYLQLTLSPMEAELLALELVKRLNQLGHSLITTPSQPTIQDMPTAAQANVKSPDLCICIDLPFNVNPDCPKHGVQQQNAFASAFRLEQLGDGEGLSSKPPSRTTLRDAINPADEDPKTE